MGIPQNGKFNTLLIAIIMMAILLCFSSQVNAAQDGDYTYTVTDGKAEVAKYTGAGGDIAIPDTLGGYNVTGISDHAFTDCSGLTTVTISNGITSIGQNAFDGCSGLTSITIPLGVTSIDYYAFCLCTSLTSITIPQSVRSINERAFYGCSDLASITFISATTIIYGGGDTIPATTKIIGHDPSNAKTYATKYSREFEIVTPQSIDISTPASKISYLTGDALDITGLIVKGNYGDGSTKVENITATNITGFNSDIPAKDQVLTITVGTKTTTYKVQIVAPGDYTYTIVDEKAEITGYTGPGGSVTIPSTLGGGFPVTSIGFWAFDGWESITSITIPQGVTNIGRSAFEGCTGLTSISVPQGVISIGALAFSSCSNLISISIPQSVTSIGGQAFSRCPRLTSVTIPQGTTSIGGLDFYGCKSLTSVIIPEGVTSIEQAAFECSGLTSIIIPQNVTKIGYYAFNGCLKLNSITFKSATTTITDDVDTIPAATKIIGYDPSTAKTYATKHNRTFEAIGPQSIAITTPATKLSYNVGDSLDITGLVVTGLIVMEALRSRT